MNLPQKDESRAVGPEKQKDDDFFLQPPSITLPKGGGAIKSIDEKFSVNAVNGTGALSIPLPITPSRNNSAPSLNLSYNSGSGNGEFGLGWSLQTSFITRKTDKGLPQYLDQDVYLLSGAEDLVPVPNPKPVINDIAVFLYRPRIEGAFSRIERWVNVKTNDTHWRVTSRDNVLSVYGPDAGSRITDPQDNLKIFKWLLAYSCDDKGDITLYQYKKEDLAGIGTALYDKNKPGRCTNMYLRQVLYGNKTPFYRGGALPAEGDFLFRLLFDYGEYDPAGMGFYTNINHAIPGDVHTPKKSWDNRKDAFSNCRAGFDIRTYRRCRRVLLFHCFEELRAAATPCLVQSMELQYADGDFSYLNQVVRKGHKLNAAGTAYDTIAWPPMDFSYQQPGWDTDISAIETASRHVPSPADGAVPQWTDLYSEGIQGILTEHGTGWYYTHNLGNGEFSEPQPVTPKPSFSGLATGTLSIRDLAGNGKKYAVGYNGAQQGFFGLAENDEWEPFQPFHRLPVTDLKNPNLKWIDLDGDGIPDILLSEEDIFCWYPARGEEGFAAPAYAIKAKDEERGPAIVFADAVQTVFLADMTGDGLTDIVRIRNGEVCYWANMGYGRFSAKVSMENAPIFDHPDNFNPVFLRLADIDGSGTTDIVYLGRKDFRVWSNLNGNSWRANPGIINSFPEISGLADVSVFDLLGVGTAAIVWTSPLPGDNRRPLRYIDLNNGQKPHLLISYDNNLGKQVSLQYLSSTHFYLEDKKKGTPWVTKLAFPVHVVAQTAIYDTVSKARFVSSYAYHHGYYDAGEREFRGFARVDQTDTETFPSDQTLNQAPVLTRTWFHTGAFLSAATILGQYQQEYFQNAVFAEHHLPDAYIELPAGMKAEDLPSPDYREAFRACKGRMLRKEIYAQDGSELAGVPYSVTEENCYLKLLQPRGSNPSAVYLAATSESITYNYERAAADPRIKHDCNIGIDEYNNVTAAVAVVYPRIGTEAGLPAAVKAAQTALHVVLTENTYTIDVNTDNDYRLRVKAESQVFEVTGANPAHGYFSLAEMKGINGAARKLISQDRVLYAADDAVTPLALKQLGPKGLKYQSYKLVFDSSLLNSVYGARVDSALLAEGKYVQLDAADQWWMASGTSGYPANPADHFFSPDKFINPYNTATLAAVDTKYHLYIPVSQDAVGNQTTVVAMDFRVMQAVSIKDANDNITEVAYDIAGLVAGTAQKGKGADADDLTGFVADLDEAAVNAFFTDPEGQGAALLQHASSRIVYDLHHLPSSAATIQRERHFKDVQGNGGADNRQYSVEYSGGLGQVLLKKVQGTPHPLWVGSGRKVLNNKGNPVKEYQPYFSADHRYEDVEVGPTSIKYYDPTGRVIRTVLSNETYSTIGFTGWQRTEADYNDNVVDSEWYKKRINRLIDAQLTAEGKDPVLEQEAAAKAAKHNATPVISFFDTLGAEVGKRSNNNDTIYNRDIKGKVLSVVDSLGHTVIQYQYDLAGNALSESGTESGMHLHFSDVLNNKLRLWDSRQYVFFFTYDALLRPLSTRVTGGDGIAPLDAIIGKTTYGEGQADDKLHNLRTQAFVIFDQSGMTTRTDFDFNGNPLGTKKQFCADFDKTISWAGAVTMEEDIYVSDMQYDALKRVIAATAPHIDGKPASAYFPAYNESSRMGSMEVSIRGAAKTPYVTKVNYNEKGMRTDIQYGNGVKTLYTYDKNTFRLLSLRTTRPAIANGFSNALFNDATVVQDLHYTYDPMGNITSIVDKALVTLFYDGEQVQPINKFEYDAEYQLLNATGRKQAGQTDIQHTRNDFNYRNQPFIDSGVIDPNDISAFRNYQEIYSYDKAGNMQQQQHIAKNSSWTRGFAYANGNNQLTQTTLGAFSAGYSYDPGGNLRGMEHLPTMHWDFNDSLNTVDLGGGGTAYYNYDSEGKRSRKVIVRQDGSSKLRYYIGSMEIYREKNSGGGTTLERETLHLMDDKDRIAMADTETTNGAAGATLVRYQLGNHLMSAALELDDGAKLISFEEYFPFGTTSFSTTDGTREVPAKRYRYTGKERDEESGLNYHGDRYYAPWIGRWTAADKMKKKETGNRYSYVRNNPVIYRDETGAFEEPTHGALTYRLALAAGFKEEEAAHIALATAGMDHAPETRPGDTIPEMAKQIILGRTSEYHYPTQEHALAQVDADIAQGKKMDPATFGRHLHSLEDVGFKEAPGPHTRSDEHLLPELTGVLGIGFLGGGAATLAAGVDNRSSAKPWIIAAAVALFTLGVIFFTFSIMSHDIGHPGYLTERINPTTGRHNISYSFSHVADEAFQDPERNSAEMRLIYKKLRAAHIAKYGPDAPNGITEDQRTAMAEAAIKGDVSASTNDEINAYLNDESLKDDEGKPVRSYADWVEKQGEGKEKYFDDTPAWDRSVIDASLDNGKDYKYYRDWF